MREDQLSPELGRLIDAAKAAAGRSDAGTRTEAVALLTEDVSVFVGCTSGAAPGTCRAAEEALAAWRAAGGDQILAAAVASGDATLQDVEPCPSCLAALAAVDPYLGLVVKRKGRWVLVSLSDSCSDTQAAAAEPEDPHA